MTLPVTIDRATWSALNCPRSLFSRLTSAHRIAVDLLGERVARMASERNAL